MIKFENVSKRYPNGFEALKNINLTIEQGEFVAIIGLSGAGKSTLIRTINRMHDITEGTLTVDGTLENVFVPVTLDLDASPALLLYNLLQGLASSLAALADGTGEVPAVNDVPATSSAAGTARSTRPERAAEAAAAIRDTIAEVRGEQGTAQRPKLSELGAFVCSDISTALAGLRKLGFAVTFIVDEAQELARCNNEDLDRLRSIVADTGGVCTWLFVGTGDLVDIDHRTVNRETAFARLMEAATVSVAHFPPDRRAEIIAHMLDDPNVLGTADAGMHFTPDAIAYLAEYTGGHARSTLKIANAVLTAARRGPGSDSPFARKTKRYISTADIQWVLRGGGVRADDSIAYDSVRSDFREIEQRSGVEMALRALLKLEGDGEREPSLAQLVAAAQELDDEKAADADGLPATLGRGMGTLVSRGFVDRQAAKTPEGGTEERYTFASVMYERFARFGYRDVVAARLVDMATRGHVSDETRAREAELVWSLGARVVARMPIIPGFTDSHENVEGNIRVLLELGIGRADVLPFHQLGESKYDSVGRAYALRGMPQLTDDDVAWIVDALEARGIRAVVHGE